MLWLLMFITVKSILFGLKFLPKKPINCVLVGGGQNNLNQLISLRKIVHFKYLPLKN